MCANCKSTQQLHFLGYILIPFIKIYQYGISPLLGPKCRFIPTCSQYGEAALKKYGLLKGSWLLLKRLSKCRPGGGSGYDPVP